MKRDPYIEALVDVAMRTFCYDSKWDSDEEPEMKYNRDKLRRDFTELVSKHGRSGPPCVACGEGVGIIYRNMGPFEPAVILCSKCAAIPVERKMVRRRITGFPGHNRGKKFIPGVGYVTPKAQP